MQEMTTIKPIKKSRHCGTNAGLGAPPMWSKCQWVITWKRNPASCKYAANNIHQYCQYTVYLPRAPNTLRLRQLAKGSCSLPASLSAANPPNESKWRQGLKAIHSAGGSISRHASKTPGFPSPASTRIRSSPVPTFRSRKGLKCCCDLSYTSAELLESNGSNTRPRLSLGTSLYQSMQKDSARLGALPIEQLAVTSTSRLKLPWGSCLGFLPSTRITRSDRRATWSQYITVAEL